MQIAFFVFRKMTLLRNIIVVGSVAEEGSVIELRWSKVESWSWVVKGEVRWNQVKLVGGANWSCCR
jgi:hypothetical protein